MKRITQRIFFLLMFMLLLCTVRPSTAQAAQSLPDLTRNDTPYIQNLIDCAITNGQPSVTIPSVNPADGSALYRIGDAVVLPSNITVYLDNCTLRLNDDSLCNFFMSEGCYNSSMSADDELENIKIIGIGNAVLDGGVHNGVTEKTATRPNGYSTVRHNTSIHFRNVNNFEISNLTIKEPRYWGMTFLFSRNGTISDITFDCSNEAPNQDGIDLRIGCNNITIEDISGVTGDDTVALTALNGVSDSWFAVSGKAHDIHDVTIHNVKAYCAGGHALVRLLAHHGNQVYNVDIRNVEDLSTTVPNVVLRLGDTNYAGSGTPMSYGDIHHITVDGVISNAQYALYAGNHNVSLEHVTYNNITVKYKYGYVTNLTPTGKTFVPLTHIDGEPIFLFDGSDTTDWQSNATRTAANYGFLSDAPTTERTAQVWTMAANGNPLQMTTPVFTTNSANYNSFRVSLLSLDNGYDRSAADLVLYYSTDNGTSWTQIPLTMAEHDKAWTILSGSGSFYVSSFTSALIPCPDAPITHMRIQPYSDSSFPGAFRLLSMDVRGSTSYFIRTTDAANGTVRVDTASGTTGTTVTVIATPKEGYYCKSIFVDDQAISGHTFQISGNHTVRATFAKMTAFYGANLLLGDTLDMNFYIAKSDVTDANSYAKIVRSYADDRADDIRIIPTSQWSTSGSYYKITYDGLVAKEMCDDIHITVYNSNDVVTSSTWTDSIRTYVMRMVDRADQKDARTLFIDMLNYGAAAQQTFTYATDNLANALLTDTHQADATQTARCENKRVMTGNVYGSSLELTNKIVLNFYFTGITEGMYAQISYTDYLGKAVSYRVEYTDFVANNNTHKLSANKLAVADGNTLVTCTVYNADGTQYASVTDSMTSYLARFLPEHPWFGYMVKFISSTHDYMIQPH